MDKGNNSFWIQSYEKHSEHDKAPDFEKLETWKSFDTIDAWRHKRMYDSVLPLISADPLSKWLTIGDGRYGSDANYLIRNHVTNVLATSIADTLLKKSKEDGFIAEYKVENAERLSFEDNSFDFVFCKESYHHFPRPMIAFYEMLRVAGTALIIIEPNDVNLKLTKESKTVVKPKRKIQLMKDFIKDIFGLKRYEYNTYNPNRFETVGNYIYSTSEREFEKAALGLNLPAVAFKGINDYYDEGVEFQTAMESSPLFTNIKTAIAAMDTDCEKNNKPYNILVSIIFKIIPSENIIHELSKAGFRVDLLPRNPYA
jgi:ubiquinone/menaquinone biosynthesis C-methylase UbiE